ncbi:MAG: two-component regulator propeller domain-containing protein, partial [Ferruginibacter sp.]
MKSKQLSFIQNKFYKRSLCALLVNCLIFHLVLSQSFPYKFNYITVDDGLSHTDANDIAQDRKGYIWIATNFGLDRYDGYSIKKFYNTNVPLNNAFKNRVFRIYPDDNGNLWLATEDGLQRFNPETEKYTDFTANNEKNSPVFWKLFKPGKDLIYRFANYKVKLYSIKSDKLEEQQLDTPANVQFLDMLADRNGTLYFASDKGLWKLDSNRKFVNIAVSGLARGNLSNLFFDKNNNLLITAGNTVFLTGENPQIQKTLKIKKSFICKDSKQIQSITGGNSMDYWINTGSGLIRLDSRLNFIQTINSKSAQQSLNSNGLINVFIDRTDCLWVGTAGGGVNYCDLNQKLFYTLQHIPGEQNSLTGDHIKSVKEDGENLWIGTGANGLNHYDLKTQKFTAYDSHTSTVKLKSDEISSLTLDDDRNLWIGSASGIEILRPDRKTLWKPPGYDKFPTVSIVTLVKDVYGNIWFGNLEMSGVIWKDKHGYYQIKYYSEAHFILSDKEKPILFFSTRHGIKQVFIDSQGNINKTLRYQASGKPNSISSNYVSPIAKQNDSTYWVGTIGGALNRLSMPLNDASYTVKLFGSSYGVFNDVESLEIDNKGNIWMGGDGLEYLNPTTGKLIRYDKNDGLQGNSFKVHASSKGADGRLYFGGIKGLNYFYPDQIKPNRIGA